MGTPRKYGWLMSTFETLNPEQVLSARLSLNGSKTRTHTGRRPQTFRCRHCFGVIWGHDAVRDHTPICVNNPLRGQTLRRRHDKPKEDYHG